MEANFEIKTHKKLRELLGKWSKVATTRDEDFESKLCWCIDKCKGKFRDMKENNQRVWYFENEYDAIIFAMRWGK